MWKSIVRRVLCLPLFLGMLPVLALWSLWGARLWMKEGILFLELKKASWPLRKFPNTGGACWGYSILLRPNQNPSVTIHELRHVQQLESGSIAGIALGVISAVIVGNAWGALAFALAWFATPILVYVGSMLVAVLNNKNGYWNSFLEEDARNEAEK